MASEEHAQRCTGSLCERRLFRPAGGFQLSSIFRARKWRRRLSGKRSERLAVREAFSLFADWTQPNSCDWITGESLEAVEAEAPDNGRATPSEALASTLQRQ